MFWDLGDPWLNIETTKEPPTTKTLLLTLILSTPLTHAEQITSAIRSLDLKNNRLEIWPRGHCERTTFDFPKEMRKELKTFYNLKSEITIECKNPLTS